MPHNKELVVYNTLTRKKEELRGMKNDEIRMYCCGPTVYSHAHIGNMRSYLFEDLLKRAITYNGYKVTHVMNITDVGHLVSDANLGEDKMRLAARKEHRSMYDIAAEYTDIFLKDSEKLNIIRPLKVVKATDHIPEMLSLLEKLDEKGFLYKVSTGIYYDTSKFKSYGELTGMTFDRLNKHLIAGMRVERAEGIRNTTDFAVWRFAHGDEKEMIWDSKWGKGFPGWHLECSAMSMKYLGTHFDLHCGGIDHIPIHHTNEIAQSEGASGEKFVNYWVHVAFLTVNGGKMAKSLGNVYTIRDLIDKGYNPLAYRLFILSGNYHNQQNFTFEALGNTQKTLYGIYSFVSRVADAAKSGKKGPAELKEDIERAVEGFFTAVNNDLDMPTALKQMHALFGLANKKLAKGELKTEDARTMLNALIEFDLILGLDLEKHTVREKLPEEIESLIQEREKLRKEQNFTEADRIRQELGDKYGMVIEDTEYGPVWYKKN